MTAGKVAIVTGASRGIGLAIARGLAEGGAKVVLSGRKQEAVDEVAATFREAGWEATAVAAHMGDVGSIERLIEAACKQYGGLDILVNNAAANPHYGPMTEASLDVFNKIVEVNIRGPFELSRRAYAVMVKRGGGSIIHISSVAGIRPEPHLALYNMSKAALISLTKSMAQEWGRDGVRVNAICPGLIQTKFSAALWEDEAQLASFLGQVPLGRIGHPEDIATLAVYLASEASSYCTGSIFTVDGGSTI